MTLTISYSEFYNRIHAFKKEGEAMSRKDVRTEDELKEAESVLREWKGRCVAFMQESFGEQFSELISDFQRAGGNRFHFDGMRTDFPFRMGEHKDKVRLSCENLNDCLILLSLVDSIARPDRYAPRRGEDMSVDEKMYFLLDKLKVVAGDGREFPVQWIFEANEVSLTNYMEASEITRELKDLGLIDSTGGIGEPMARINTSGIRFLQKIECEESSRNEAKNETPNVTNNITVHTMTNSSIQQSSPHATQNTTINGNTLADLKEFLKELEDIIPHIKESVPDLEELKADISSAQTQVQSPKPKKAIIQESLKSIRNILEQITSTALTPVVIGKVQNLGQMVEQLLNQLTNNI